MTRREFLSTAAGAALCAGCDTLCSSRASEAHILFGTTRGIGDVPLMADLGYDFWETAVAGALRPDDADWSKTRSAILAAPIPLRSCNGFLPGKFRLTGPNASFDEPLKYAELACRRADELGMKTIVFGSSGARNAPDGFPKEKAEAQFVEFLKRLAERIDSCRVSVVLEPLQPKEANFLNFVKEGVAMCREVGSPRIRQLADIFHMEQGGEDASSITLAGDLLLHCHIAEKGDRTAPGMRGDGSEFVPYFKALVDIGYRGGVSCECGWGDKKDLRRNLAVALSLMKRLAGQTAV